MKWFFWLLGALVIASIFVGHLARRPRFKPGDAITIKQCTRGYWYQVDHGKYKTDDFSCTHYHVTLTRIPK